MDAEARGGRTYNDADPAVYPKSTFPIEQAKFRTTCTHHEGALCYSYCRTAVIGYGKADKLLIVCRSLLAVKNNRNNKRIRAIWEKTGGRCHFCGDPVRLNGRGYTGPGSDGSWEIDHVTQRAKGGLSGVENYLPACTRCNRLRWHRTGAQLRQVLVLGLIARREIEKLTVRLEFVGVRSMDSCFQLNQNIK